MVDHTHSDRLPIDRTGKAFDAHLQQSADRWRHVLPNEDKNAAVGQIARFHFDAPKRRVDELDQGGTGHAGMAALVFFHRVMNALLCLYTAYAATVQ